MWCCPTSFGMCDKCYCLWEMKAKRISICGLDWIGSDTSTPDISDDSLPLPHHYGTNCFESWWIVMLFFNQLLKWTRAWCQPDCDVFPPDFSFRASSPLSQGAFCSRLRTCSSESDPMTLQTLHRKATPNPGKTFTHGFGFWWGKRDYVKEKVLEGAFRTTGNCSSARVF